MKFKSVWTKLKSRFISNNKLLKQEKLVSSLVTTRKKTILIIDDYVPYHDKSSGSKRLYEIILLLSNLNFRIIFLPNDGLATEPYYSKLISLGIEVLLHTPNRSRMLKELKSLLPAIDFAWISRPLLNRKYQKLIRRNKNIKIIFDTVDLHYIRMLRQADNVNDERLRKKALKTKKLELKLANNSDATLTVTETEKCILEKEAIKNVFVIPNIHQLNIPEISLPFDKRKGILFIGSYKHEPNIDAVKWLVKDIMPIFWGKSGKIPLYLLGSDPTEEVLQLAGSLVFVPGYLADVTEYFLTTRVFVAPLKYGAGMKGKIGQSLEFGLPIVSTRIGTEGMNLTDELDVLIANNTIEFAQKLIQLYQDSFLWNKIKDNSANSLQDYSPESVTRKLRKLFQALS